MNTISFSCTIQNNSHFDDLLVELWANNKKFFDSNITDTVNVDYVLNDDEADHVLQIVLKNKTCKHTNVDINGKILQDALISVHNIKFDDITVDELFFEHSVYTHDYNGTGPEMKDKFFGDIGCNGTVKFKFYTPFYMWLLEHM